LDYRLETQNHQGISIVFAIFPDVFSIVNQGKLRLLKIWDHVQDAFKNEVQFLLEKGWIPLKEDVEKFQKSLDPEIVAILEEASKLERGPVLEISSGYRKGKTSFLVDNLSF